MNNKILIYIKKILLLLQRFKIMKAHPSITPNLSLQIHIENAHPIELINFTKSLSAISNQFSTFSAKNGDTKELKDAKLYVKQVKEGSIVIELIEFASTGLLPIMAENADMILSFFKYIKEIYDYFLKGEGEKPTLTVQDCKELMSIVETPANDFGSKMSLSVVNNGDGVINNTFVITNTDANAIQNHLKRESDIIKIPSESDNTYDKQLMTLYQARSDMNSKSGNKAIIDTLSEKPLNVVFESEDIKEKMLNSNNFNPLKTGYLVDVVIQTVRGVPCAYKIINLHDMFSLEE